MHLPLILLLLGPATHAEKSCNQLKDYEAALTAYNAGNPSLLHQLTKNEFQSIIDQRNRLLLERARATSSVETIRIQKLIKAAEQQIDDMAYEAKAKMGISREEALKLAAKSDPNTPARGSTLTANSNAVDPSQLSRTLTNYDQKYSSAQLQKSTVSLQSQAASSQKRLQLEQSLAEQQRALNELKAFVPSASGGAKSNEVVKLETRIEALQDNIKKLQQEQNSVMANLKSAAERIRTAPTSYEISTALQHHRANGAKGLTDYLTRLQETKQELQRFKQNWDPRDLPAVKDIDQKILEIDQVLKTQKSK